MNKVQMGKVYFKLDNTAGTKEMLNQFFLDWGFQEKNKTTLGDEYFQRVTTYTNDTGLTFDVIWYKNLCNIRFGNNYNGAVECSFDRIIGSYLPTSGCHTFSLQNEGKDIARLLIPEMDNVVARWNDA